MALPAMPRAGSRPPLDCMRLKRPAKSRLSSARPNWPQIAVDHGLHVSRKHGGGRALVLAELAGYVARARDADAGKVLGNHLGYAPLVRGVRVAVEETDRDGLVVAALQRLRQTMPRRLFVQGGDDLTAGAHAFGNLEGVAARHHGLGLAVVDVVDGAPALPLQREQIAKPLGGEERDLRALALQYCVGRHGRAVSRDRRWAPSASPDSSSAAMAPRCGALGVLGTLVMRTPPASNATRSVNVPPTSTPTRVVPLMRGCGWSCRCDWGAGSSRSPEWKVRQILARNSRQGHGRQPPAIRGPPCSLVGRNGPRGP